MNKPNQSSVPGAQVQQPDLAHDRRCNFAYPGTWGHECGKPAVFAAVMPSTETQSGTYYGRRCESCRNERGGENSRVIRFEPFNASQHINRWR